MHYRDIVIDEMRKTALIIAKLLGLKAVGKQQEFAQQVNALMLKDYDTDLETILALNDDDFKALINSDKYSFEKLNALAQILYMFAEPFEKNQDTRNLLTKVMLVFDVLEQKYRYQSFDNITKRNSIYRYFNIKP